MINKKFDKIKSIIDEKLILWRKEPIGGMIVFRPKGLEVYCDEGTVSLLELIKKGIGFEEIIDLIKKYYKISYEEASRILEKRLDLILELNISACPETHPYTSTAPHIAAIEITNVCNLACKYCYANSSPSEMASMTVNQVLYILDEIKKANIPHLWITGGEPLLHPEIERILREAAKRDFYIVLATNGIPLYNNNKKLILLKNMLMKFKWH